MKRIFLGLALSLNVTTSSVAEELVLPYAFTVASESMLPTLKPKDYVWARRINFNAIERGDVVVFRENIRTQPYIFRAIALEEDVVGMIEGRLIVNGRPVGLDALPDEVRPVQHVCPGTWKWVGDERHCAMKVWRETLPSGASHQIVLPPNRSSSFLEFKARVVPKGHIFVLGDNRANAADSRVSHLGPIPNDYIFYRVTRRNVIHAVD